jgi:hypothetical protein
MSVILIGCGGDGNGASEAPSGVTVASTAVRPSGDHRPGAGTEPAQDVPLLNDAECAALIEFLERGAPSPIDGTVTVDLAPLPEVARRAAGVLVASYREVVAALRAGETPSVGEDVSGLVELADGMSSPEVVAAVEELDGLVTQC